MSKLDNLIEKLCANGIRYEKLSNVCDVIFGFSFKANLFKNAGLPIVKTTNIQEGYIDESNIVFFDKNDYSNNLDNYMIYPNNIVLGMSGTIKVGINNSSKVYYLNQRVCKFNPHEELNNKFLYYILSNSINELFDSTSGSSIKNLSNENIKSLRIPVPPIEVQNEIVDILDNYTKISLELKEKLTEELKARQKQYEYYRDELLLFKNEEYPQMKLADIAIDMYRGTGIKRTEVTREGTSCVRYGEIYTTYNITFDKCISHTNEDMISSKKYFEYGDVLFAITGENVEEIGKSIVYLGDERCLAGGDIVVMKHKQNPKYMAYVLSTTIAQIQKSKGKVKSKVVHSSVPSLKEIVIPVPPLEEQEKVANQIEKFDKLCNDLSEEIPAEIALRQRQYEYYRDKLLHFKELKVNE